VRVASIIVVILAGAKMEAASVYFSVDWMGWPLTAY
jgi:hypothetical protein